MIPPFSVPSTSTLPSARSRPLTSASAASPTARSPRLAADTRPYLRDCYDHTVHALDLVESYRETASSLSNRMNDVMKVLTIIATVFIPLSFVVGVYGMNFDTEASPWNMPELGLRYGYPLLWLVMLAIVVGMLIWFRRKGWF